jgi:DNA-binding CsgD family transcriptional regulator
MPSASLSLPSRAAVARGHAPFCSLVRHPLPAARERTDDAVPAKVLPGLDHPHASRLPASRWSFDGRSGAPVDLTQRERQVLAYAALGHTNKLIAYELGLAASTVCVLFARASTKLGTPARTETTRAFTAMSNAFESHRAHGARAQQVAIPGTQLTQRAGRSSLGGCVLPRCSLGTSSSRNGRSSRRARARSSIGWRSR